MTKPKIKTVLSPLNSNFLLIFGENTQRVYVISNPVVGGSQSWLNALSAAPLTVLQNIKLPQSINLEQLRRSFIVPHSNIAFLLLRQNETKQRMIGLSFPVIFNCDGCPYCSGPEKKDCLICKEKDQLWLNNECIKCP
jgi:hypothetical protein